jgi:hypothetical protein
MMLEAFQQGEDEAICRTTILINKFEPTSSYSDMDTKPVGSKIRPVHILAELLLKSLSVCIE